MNLDWDDPAARGLRCYVRLVAEEIGVGDEASLVQLDEPVCAYLALDFCPADRPENYFALVWDERHGWALALEESGGTRLTSLGCLDAGRLPTPRMVAAYVCAACAGGGFGPPAPIGAEVPPDLSSRLALYAEQFPALRSSVSVGDDRA